MPGLNIIYKPNCFTAEKKRRILRDLSGVRLKPAGNISTIYNDSNIIVSLVSYYENYPFNHFKENDCHIFLEGYIFNHRLGDPIEKLRELAVALNLSNSALEKKIGDFVKAVDGEFIVAMYDEKTGNLAVFNDILGRLPIYYGKIKDILYLSREVKFITAFTDNLTLSAHSLAQSLVFLFPVGDRTLLTDVKKMMPASLFLLQGDEKYPGPGNLFEWNFSINKINQPAKTVADELVTLYLDGVRARARSFEKRKNILALSGGLDSRTVLAGLMKADEMFTAIIFSDHRGLSLKDLAVAKEIASIFNFGLNIFDLPGIDINSMNRLIYMKDGLCLNSIMGTVNRSHEIIAEKYGVNIAYHTGAGGGLILAPRCPVDSIKSGEFLDKIIYRNTLTFMEEAAAVMRIDADDFRDRLNDHFLSYPEQTFEDKYGHFMVFEHLFNFSFEGDDRERFYFWNCAPFYSSPFFKKAMQISDSTKMNHRLFAEFLKILYPRLASIKYANWGIPITSHFTPYYLKIKNWLLEKPKLAGLFRNIRGYRQLWSAKGRLQFKDQDIVILKNNILKIISTCPELNEHVATEQITKLLPGWNNLYILYGINNLLTYIRFLQKSVTGLKTDRNC